MRRESDPIGNFRFVLELGFIQAASFSECTGLQMETKIFEYQEGGRNGSSLKFPEVGSVGTIALKRGITSGASSDLLFRWQHDVMNGLFDPNNNPNKRPADTNQDINQQVAIVLQDEDGIEVKRWQLFRSFPMKWIGPELKAASSEIAIETLELACEGIDLA